MRIQFETKVWRKFLKDGGWNEESYSKFKEMLKAHNASHFIKTSHIEFETEEDWLVFKLKFGL